MCPGTEFSKIVWKWVRTQRHSVVVFQTSTIQLSRWLGTVYKVRHAREGRGGRGSAKRGFSYENLCLFLRDIGEEEMKENVNVQIIRIKGRSVKHRKQ